jgi:large subunit ribosomal protein L25
LSSPMYYSEIISAAKSSNNKNMFKIIAQERKENEKADKIRKEGLVQAVLYGEGIKNLNLKIKNKDLKEAYEKAGESSLIELQLGEKSIPCLMHQVAQDPVRGEFIHIDFFHPSAKKKIEAEVELVFEGESPAVEEMGGVLVKEIQHLPVKALAQNLPKEIKVDVSLLKNLEDRILVKDLKMPLGVEALKEKEEIVALVVEPKEEKIEEKSEELPLTEESAPSESSEASKEK